MKSSDNCEPIRKNAYQNVLEIVGTAFNPFIEKDIDDCYFDCEQAALINFCISRKSTIRNIARQKVKVGFSLEEKVTAPSIPKVAE